MEPRLIADTIASTTWTTIGQRIVNFTVSLAKQGPGVLLYVIAYENILNYSVYAIFISIYIGYKL